MAFIEKKHMKGLEYIQKISGTQIRAMLSNGERPNAIFMRKEVANSIIKLKDHKFIME